MASRVDFLEQRCREQFVVEAPVGVAGSEVMPIVVCPAPDGSVVAALLMHEDNVTIIHSVQLQVRAPPTPATANSHINGGTRVHGKRVALAWEESPQMGHCVLNMQLHLPQAAAQTVCQAEATCVHAGVTNMILGHTA